MQQPPPCTQLSTLFGPPRSNPDNSKKAKRGLGRWYRPARNRRCRVGEKVIVYRTVACFARWQNFSLVLWPAATLCRPA